MNSINDNKHVQRMAVEVFAFMADNITKNPATGDLPSTIRNASEAAIATGSGVPRIVERHIREWDDDTVRELLAKTLGHAVLQDCLGALKIVNLKANMEGVPFDEELREAVAQMREKVEE